MTMMTFRLASADAQEIEEWSGRLGVARSDLIRQAVHVHLVRLASEAEARMPGGISPIEGEDDLELAADWTAAEDWSDWS